LKNDTLFLHAALAAAVALAGTSACASCGSAFCTLMTDRYAQGTPDHAGWSADLRLEAVTQKRLRSGTHDVDASQVTGEEAIERETRNRNLVASLTYATGADWSFTLRLPVVQRDHRHDLLDEDSGAVGPEERWRFTRLGDAQVLARRQFLSDDGATAGALFGGLKLPTGATRVANADGVRAERALQPGSGTTDLVLGVAGRRAVGLVDALVGQATLTQALNRHEEFKPGRRLEVSLGWSHAFSPRWGSVLQLNARHKARDQGAQAEPDNSGSTELDLSPGLTVAVGAASTLYAYVQLPLYQKVNGFQLVPRSALAVGWTQDF
jgi:hypothetical protein